MGKVTHEAYMLRLSDHEIPQSLITIPIYLELHVAPPEKWKSNRLRYSTIAHLPTYLLIRRLVRRIMRAHAQLLRRGVAGDAAHHIPVLLEPYRSRLQLRLLPLPLPLPRPRVTHGHGELVPDLPEPPTTPPAPMPRRGGRRRVEAARLLPRPGGHRGGGGEVNEVERLARGRRRGGRPRPGGLPHALRLRPRLPWPPRGHRARDQQHAAPEQSTTPPIVPLLPPSSGGGGGGAGKRGERERKARGRRRRGGGDAFSRRGGGVGDIFFQLFSCLKNPSKKSGGLRGVLARASTSGCCEQVALRWVPSQVNASHRQAGLRVLEPWMAPPASDRWCARLAVSGVLLLLPARSLLSRHLRAAALRGGASASFFLFLFFFCARACVGFRLFFLFHRVCPVPNLRGTRVVVLVVW